MTGKKLKNILALAGVCFFMSWAVPVTAEAAQVAVETSSAMYAKINAPEAEVKTTVNGGGKTLTWVKKGETYEVLEPEKNGWIKIQTSWGAGYVRSNRTTFFEKTRQKVDENVRLRRQVVDYALQFVGNPYVYGGTDPNTGADCSGFTRYVLGKSAGVSLSHNSTAQSREGIQVSREELQPGDLVFYGGAGYINHVGIYMGDNKIVHASTERTGIKISDLTYRKPVKYVNVLGN